MYGGKLNCCLIYKRFFVNKKEGAWHTGMESALNISNLLFVMSIPVGICWIVDVVPVFNGVVNTLRNVIDAMAMGLYTNTENREC